MTDKNNYTNEEHSHRFAVWTAARAATRGMKGGTTNNVEEAIESSRLRTLIDSPKEHSPISDFITYQRVHNQYCDGIIKHFKSIKDIPNGTCTYGRAAKIIAIYIKTRILNTEDHRLMNFVFPPIDSILLENLAKEYPMFKDLKKVKWTQLKSDEYNDIIARLNNEWCMKNDMKMWEVEKYWGPVR